MSKFIDDIKKYRFLLYELVSRDIKVRYRRSVLGLLWTMLNPILMMAVMTIVFSNLFRMEIENYPVYLFTGNILFAFMTESTTNAMRSIEEGGSLIKKVYIPKYIFPISKVFAGAVNFFFSIIALFLVMLVLRVPFHWTMLLIPVDMVYLMIFSIGLGMLLASTQVFFRDIAHFYGVFTLAWTYLTPVFYPKSLLEGRADILLTINPMAHYIEYMRDIVLYARIPDLKANLICLGFSMITLLIGAISFRRKQNSFILYI